MYSSFRRGEVLSQAARGSQLLPQAQDLALQSLGHRLPAVDQHLTPRGI